MPGTATIEHDPEGGWFKFIGEAAASQSTKESFDPVQMIKDELEASDFQIINIYEYGERHVEHSTCRSPAGSKTGDNEVTTVFAAYLDKGGNTLVMNFTMRRPAAMECLLEGLDAISLHINTVQDEIWFDNAKIIAKLQLDLQTMISSVLPEKPSVPLSSA